MLLPEPFPGSGGHTTALRMAAGLIRAGHLVTIHVDWGPHFAQATTGELRRFLRCHFPLPAVRVRHGRYFEPSDVLIATSWTTAPAVAAAENTAARLYFVQDFEPDFYPRDERCLLAEATYRLGIEHITIGPWLAELLGDRYDARSTTIDFGVDHDLYRPGRPAERPRLVFYARPTTARRGTMLGLETLARVKRARPDVEIVLYGSRTSLVASFAHRDAGILSRQELADLYASAHGGLVLSFTNLSLVPPEMMAAGCPVVAVDVPAVRWFLRHGENALLVEPTPEALADALLRVLDDGPLRQRLVERGRASVAELTWERSGAQFEAVVRRAVDRARLAAESASHPELDSDSRPERDSVSPPAMDFVRRSPAVAPEADARGRDRDPVLVAWLADRERARAELAATRAWFDRHPVAYLVRAWTRLTRPLPPPANRPWLPDAPPVVRGWLLLWHYGPFTIGRDWLARRRKQRLIGDSAVGGGEPRGDSALDGGDLHRGGTGDSGGLGRNVAGDGGGLRRDVAGRGGFHGDGTDGSSGLSRDGVAGGDEPGTAT